MCFYRALRVYPSPVELIVIYEKTVPPPVFQVCRHVVSLGPNLQRVLMHLT